jgi:hypothetical protein
LGRKLALLASLYRVDQAAVQSWIRAIIGEAQWSLVRVANL